MTILAILRHETAQKILLILSHTPSIKHKNLASKLEISSQALTWQINRLKQLGLIELLEDGMTNRYFLSEENIKLIKGYHNMYK